MSRKGFDGKLFNLFDTSFAMRIDSGRRDVPDFITN